MKERVLYLSPAVFMHVSLIVLIESVAHYLIQKNRIWHIECVIVMYRILTFCSITARDLRLENRIMPLQISTHPTECL